MSYFDPVIKKYLDLIRANVPEVKFVMQGEPFKIGASMLPAVFITKTGTEARLHSNAEDAHTMAMRLTLVVDVRQELDNEKEIEAGVAKLFDIMEGRDDTTYKLKPKSILNVLRSNLGVDTPNNLRTDLSSTTRVDYGPTYNNRQQVWFIESHIEFLCEYTQVR